MSEEAETPAAPERTGPAVYDAISAVMLYMSKEGISKDRKSGDGGGPRFQFRGIDDIYNALSGVMAQNRLMMLPRVLHRSQVERATKSGGVMFYTVVEAEFDLVSAEDGTKHTIRTFGEAMDSSDKSTNKAMSAAFKYAAMQAFCIPTEGDNDADAATHEVAPRDQQRTNDRGQSGGASRGGQRGGQNNDTPEDGARKYAANLIAALDKCSTPEEVDDLCKKEGKGIERLRSEFSKQFQEWDHAKGMAYARVDDIPF